MKRVLIAGLLCTLSTSVAAEVMTGAQSAAAVAAGDAARPQVAAASAPSRLAVKVLSNRADLISSGDALVAIAVPADAPKLTVRLGGRDVTGRFKHRLDGDRVALLRGLSLGRNVVVASAGSQTARAVITDHPNGGPVFSGPQTKHYRCQAGARNARCDQPATYRYLYASTDPAAQGLQPYDPADPPTDVATTTTDQGVEVPFIVRREDGFQDRDRYTILTLFTPGRKWTAWSPQKQWNHKVLITHGGGCGASYGPGDPPLDDYSGTFTGVPLPVTPSYITALGKGFAVLSTALDNTGHNCSVALNAESVLMAKERLVERYGTIRYTIGTGCSGGSIAQHTVANSYPGIYQGLITTCSYPDVITAGAQFADYHLMRLYFEDPSRWATGVAWSPTQMAQVEGHISVVNSIAADEGLFKKALKATNPCSGTVDPKKNDPATRYDPKINPGGVRCSVLDLAVNQLGRRPESDWGPSEKKVGHGFGAIPFSNTGVMYGYNALLAGGITPAQFVDLNAKVGGIDIDENFVDKRIAGNRGAVAKAYRTGLINEMNNVDEAAIINFGGPDPGIAHDYAHAFWTEERLQRDQGNTDNRVMWFGPTPLVGDLSWANEALDKMDAWLSVVEKDARAIPLARKVALDRPDDVTDRCVSEQLNTVCSNQQLQVLQLHLSTPRQEAGGPSANDIVACQRQPLTKAPFASLLVGFTDAQWKTLKKVFAGGICDWSKRGVGQGPAQTWLRYDAAASAAQQRAGKQSDRPVYGGRNLAKVPAGSGGGLMDPVWMPMFRR